MVAVVAVDTIIIVLYCKSYCVRPTSPLRQRATDLLAHCCAAADRGGDDAQLMRVRGVDDDDDDDQTIYLLAIPTSKSKDLLIHLVSYYSTATSKLSKSEAARDQSFLLEQFFQRNKHTTI